MCKYQFCSNEESLQAKKKLNDRSRISRIAGMVESAGLLYQAGHTIAGDYLMDKIKEREEMGDPLPRE